MADPYSGVAISNYNANPPADDGTVTEANRVKWSTIKTKITDPVKTRTDSMNTALIAAFAKMVGGAGITSTAISYTVLAADQGKLVRASASGITITSPDAAGVSAPFVFAVLNDSAGDITFDGSGSQTIDGDANVTVPPGAGMMVFTDGTNWFTAGQNFLRPLVAPQGYLTLLSVASSPNSPSPTSDQTAKTAIYYRPFRGNLAPIPNGTLFNVREFSELTLTLDLNHLADGIYDAFLFENTSTGAITIGTGPAWTIATAGAGARGTGAGTTELDLLKGLHVNKVAMTARNGATTYSVGAKCGLYIGTFQVDASAGQISQHVTWGQSRRSGPWNAYNRLPRRIRVGDSTASWIYGSATVRAANGVSANRGFVLCGLAEDPVDIIYETFVQSSFVAVSGSSVSNNLIGWNSLTVASGTGGSNAVYNSPSATFSIKGGGSPIARYTAQPSIGLNYAAALESVVSTTGDSTFVGGEAAMLLSISFLG